MPPEADFTAVYEQEYDRVFGYLLKCSRDWHVAEDLASEVFLAAWAAWDTWEDRDIPYSHYLRRIAYYRHGLYWKKEKRWQRRTSLYPYLAQHERDGTLADDGGIGALLDRCEAEMQFALLRAALGQLRPRPLRALALRYGLGMSEKEAARRMGIGFEAYRAVRRGAEERLRQLILGEEPTWTAKNSKRRARDVERSA